MPALDPFAKRSSISKLIERLSQDEEVSLRDIKALLTPQQQQSLADAWEHQKALREKRLQKDQQELAGWKSKREVQLEILQKAHDELGNTTLEDISEELKKSEIRGAHVFLKAFFDAQKNGKNAWSAGNIALTRAGLKRLDGAGERTRLTARDSEIKAIEDAIKKRWEENLDATAREQLKLLREHEKAENQRKK